MSALAPASPFKFLDPYERKDHAVFFGREAEETVLYEAVNKNRLVLVYGPSGAGKTSLIQCGLANRFEVTDWLPFFVRRGEDINHSLVHALAASPALGGRNVPVAEIGAAVDRISTRYLRPVYLIFDQFEELLILGSASELTTFFSILEQLLDANPFTCHLLFVLREEYFAWLAPFEARFPDFTDRRVRVEPMRPAQVAEVVVRTCTAFRLELPEPDRNAQQIANSLTGKTGISLPYLQVYLDLLWRTLFARQYPTGWSASGLPALRVTQAALDELGAIEDILERFLLDRTVLIQRRLERSHAGVPDATVRRVLDAFVTEEGTKCPLRYRLQAGRVELQPAPDVLRSIPMAVLTDTLATLENSRLIRSDGDTYELAHDSLAALIDAMRTDAERQLNDIKRRIQAAYRDYADTNEPLTRRQLDLYDEYLPQLTLTAPVYDFIETSRGEVARREAATQRALRTRWMRRVGLGFGLISFVLAIVAGILWYRADQSNEKFLQEETRRVTYQIKNLTDRMHRLYANGYTDSAVYSEYVDTIHQLERQYGSNPHLRDTLAKMLGDISVFSSRRTEQPSKTPE